MSTLLWLPSSGAAPVSPTPDGTDWAHQAGTFRALNFVNAGTALATTTYTPDAVDDTNAKNALFVCFVSMVLPPQAIPNAFISMGILAAEAVATNNLFVAWKIYGCSVDGSSNLGNIVAIQRDGTEVGTTLDGRTDAAAANLQPVFTEPWRLVVEVGLGGTPSASGSTDGHNGTMRFGEAGDFVQNSDSTDAPPYILFSQDIKTYHYGSGGLVNSRALVRP